VKSKEDLQSEEAFVSIYCCRKQFYTGMLMRPQDSETEIETETKECETETKPNETEIEIETNEVKYIKEQDAGDVQIY